MKKQFNHAQQSPEQTLANAGETVIHMGGESMGFATQNGEVVGVGVVQYARLLQQQAEKPAAAKPARAPGL